MAFTQGLSFSFVVIFGVCACRSLTIKTPHTTIYVPLKKIHVNPLNVNDNPYDDPKKYRAIMRHNENAVCAVKYLSEDQVHYETKTYSSEQEAREASAYVTHKGSCGTCSSLQDLSVYMNNKDLTKSARRCGFLSWLKPASLRCFKKIGFSDGCASTWYYNAVNTGKKCFWTCMWSFMTNEKNNPDGSELNDCLRCDEEQSGPLFKVMAGRTRRNSGLSSEIVRKSHEIADIKHDYF